MSQNRHNYNETRVLIIEQETGPAASLPPGIRIIAEGQTLADLQSPLEAKCGRDLSDLTVADGGGDGQ